ncbi:MAG: heme-binding protein [Gammaproteobacteria bacterium]
MKSVARLCFGLIALCVLYASSAHSAQLATAKALTLEVAKQISAAAEAEAAKNQWTVVIAIVDAGGHLIHLVKIDGTQYGSIDVAIQKAQTSIAFKRPTKAFEEAIAGGRTAILGVKGALPLEGGLPIVVDGETIGAIGVSGMKSTEDAQVAKAGVDALTTILK